MDRFEYFFSLTWKFNGDSKFDIVLYLKCHTGPQKSNFLFMDRLEYFFSSTWKFDGDFKSDIVLYLKWHTGPKSPIFESWHAIYFIKIYKNMWKFCLWSGINMRETSCQVYRANCQIECLTNQIQFYTMQDFWRKSIYELYISTQFWYSILFWYNSILNCKNLWIYR